MSDRSEREDALSRSTALPGAIEVASRFCGPPESGNGGYVAGRLAAYVPDGSEASQGKGVSVRLFAPPPLDRPLDVRQDDVGATLFEGETRLAEARPCDFDLEVPSPPDFVAATEAAKSFRGFEEHVFPRCFVCGFQRPEGDGLRIFPGALSASGRFAAPWVPDGSLATDGGEDVAEPFLWAALDCPGAFSFPQPEGRVVLLGELQARIEGRVRVGERCVLTSWFLGQDGRKIRTASALHGEAGGLVGAALGLWIEIDPARVPGR